VESHHSRHRSSVGDNRRYSAEPRLDARGDRGLTGCNATCGVFWNCGAEADSEEFGGYSYLNAAIGSTEDALRAGIKAAKAAVTIRTKVTAVKISGFWTLPSAHFDNTRLKKRLRTTPQTTPPSTWVAVDARTSFTTLPRVAPSAIRMPNSLVLCATP
jgi:hypothetical protein